MCILSSTVCHFQQVQIDQLYKIVMLTRERGLMFRTFAQFLFKMCFFFQRGLGVCKVLVEIPEGWRFIFLYKNGNSGEVGGLIQISSMVGVWIFSGTIHSFLQFWRSASAQ